MKNKHQVFVNWDEQIVGIHLDGVPVHPQIVSLITVEDIPEGSTDEVVEKVVRNATYKLRDIIERYL